MEKAKLAEPKTKMKHSIIGVDIHNYSPLDQFKYYLPRA